MTDEEMFKTIEDKLFTVIYKKTMELYPDLDTFTYAHRQNVKITVSKDADPERGYFAYNMKTDVVNMKIGHASLAYLLHHDLIMVDLDKKKLTGMTKR